MDAVVFYIFAGLALMSAVVVVGQRNPVYSAFALIATLCSLSVIYGLLGSSFIAVLQVVVYAGAIMVLFLFVIMLLAVPREPAGSGPGLTVGMLAIGLGVLLALQVGAVLTTAQLGTAGPALDGSARGVANALFSLPFLYAFEASSVLIVAALVGAVVIARKENP
jgi:NADH-quinone oxidoreductase subunit J